MYWALIANLIDSLIFPPSWAWSPLEEPRIDFERGVRNMYGFNPHWHVSSFMLLLFQQEQGRTWEDGG